MFVSHELLLHLAGVSGARRSALSFSDVDKDPSARMSDFSHELKPKRGIPEVVLTSSSSLSSNKHKCNHGAIPQDHSSQMGKFCNQEGKSRIIASFNQPRLKIPAGSRSAHGRMCEGIGHSTESCPTMSSQVLIFDAKNSQVKKNGKMGDVIETAIVERNDFHTRSRCLNQSDEFYMSSSNVNCKVSSSDYQSRGNPFSADETNEQEFRVAKDMRRHADENTRVACMIKVENSNSIATSDERLYVRDVPRFSQISAVPELDCIWQYGLFLSLGCAFLNLEY